MSRKMSRKNIKRFFLKKKKRVVRRRLQKGGSFGGGMALGMFAPEVLKTISNVLKIRI